MSHHPPAARSSLRQLRAEQLRALFMTSPLEGEVGSRSEPGGGCLASTFWKNTPLPNPPPQGGREQDVMRCDK